MRFVMLALLPLVAVAAASQSSGNSKTRSTNDGVYTRAQAEQGSVLFSDVCLACHPDPFWRTGWPGRTVADLYSIVLRDMPDDNPGSLRAQEVAAVLAYILQSNGAPAGTTSLPADETMLSTIRIVDPPPSTP